MRVFLNLLTWTAISWSWGLGTLFAQQTERGDLPSDRQQQYDELTRIADRSLMIGYILAGTGFLIIILGLIYSRSRRKQDRPNE